MSDLMLPGIDGSNPLGFFAALGALRILDDRVEGDPVPQLSWRELGYWRPVLHGVADHAMVVEAVMADLEDWRDEPAIELAYVKEGGTPGAGRRAKPDETKSIRDLKPPPTVQTELYDEAAKLAARGHQRTARYLACFGTEVATDNQGYTKPTALHFTAGQQQFLAMALSLRDGLEPKHIEEALLGPWRYESKLPSFSWTGTGQRLWAYRAADPSSEKRGSCPGAEWLAFLGLSFFPCAPASGYRSPVTRTTGVVGGWKDSSLTWPVWTDPGSSRAVAGLLGSPQLDRLGPSARKARGIAAIFRAAILRSDQGGYGSFSPAQTI